MKNAWAGNYLFRDKNDGGITVKRSPLAQACLWIAVAAFMSGVAAASAFWPGTVKNVPTGDHLNIRKLPNTSAQVLGVFNNGDNLSMTGWCKNSKTKKTFAVDGTHSVLQNYNMMKAPNVWCEIWLETPPGSGKYGSGWAKGKYVWPE